MTTSPGARRFAGLTGLLAGIGLVVAARAIVGQPAHGQTVMLPAAAPQPTTTTSTTTTSTTTSPTTSGTGSPSTTTTAPAAKTLRHTVNGSVVQTPYGSVQVAVVFDGSKIVEVQALQTPSDQDRSVQIAQVATPILRQEVLSAQSARVDAVSGATYTSDGYAQSVQYAIDHSAS